MAWPALSDGRGRRHAVVALSLQRDLYVRYVACPLLKLDTHNTHGLKICWCRWYSTSIFFYKRRAET